MERDPLARLRTALAGRYRLEAALGHGGMATVWRARDLRHDRDVALKVLRPELAAAIGAERFQREIRLTAQLQHPNILPVFDSGDADGILWYTMPLVEGASLRDRLIREGRLPPAEALALVAEMADALGHAHARGIVHRDIKPENILLAHGHALVADFGIARASAEADGARLTATGMALGTVAYMSPEQAAGDPALDSRSDQYALACVLHEMLTGRVPHAGAPPQSMLARRLTEEVPPLPDDVRVSGSVRTALGRALERDPAARFPTVQAFADALRPAAAAEATRPMPVTTVSTRPARRWRVPAIAVGLGAAAAIAAWLARDRGRDVSIEPSVAVIPLENRSADPADVYLSDGIGDELIVRLTALPSLRVAPRSSVARLRGSTLDLDSIARGLGVAHLVTGTVARLGDSVRVNVELVDVAGRRQQWAFQRVLPAGEVAPLVDTLAAGIAGSLRPGDVSPRLAGPATTRDSLAYDHYLRGQFHFYRFSERDLLAARAQYDSAIARDPAFAAAWLGRGSALTALISGMGRLPPSEGLTAIRQAVDTALVLDPSLGPAFSLRGQLATWFEWDWASAERAHARALALAPRDALVLQRAGFLRSVRGEHDSALALNARSRALEPANALMWAGAANFNWAARRWKASLDAAERALSLDPRFGPALDFRARALVRLGRLDEGIASAERQVAMAPEVPVTHATLALVLADAGRAERARRIADSLERAGAVDPSRIGHLARTYALLGDREGAFRMLDRALRMRSSVIAYLRVEPDFDALREDARYRRLLQDAGLDDRSLPPVTQP
jgi:serine/threonine-protein kinase